MKAIKKLSRRSKTATFFFSALSCSCLCLLFRIEALLSRLNDYLSAKLAWLFFMKDNHFQKSFFQLLGKYVPPFRYKDSWAKKILKEIGPFKVSFAEAIFLRNAYKSKNILPEWRINNKYKGVLFASELGMRTPRQFQQNIAFSEILPFEGTVMKPTDGHSANGVFIIKSFENILELSTGAILNSWDQLAKRVLKFLENDPSQKDQWLVEQLIFDEDGQLANDIKFFAFYGRVEVIAEMKRHPRILCDMIDKNNQSFESGLYSKDYCFKGRGVSKSEISLAEKISLEIPAPFMRIDFLRGVDGLYFCEFTPRPSSVGAFNKKYDQLLGKMFHEAQARLFSDLVSGKKFEAFTRATSLNNVTS